jgi:hypothetical protein
VDSGAEEWALSQFALQAIELLALLGNVLPPPSADSWSEWPTCVASAWRERWSHHSPCLQACRNKCISTTCPWGAVAPLPVPTGMSWQMYKYHLLQGKITPNELNTFSSSSLHTSVCKFWAGSS